MSDYGFKVSLPGYDVTTATPEQCAVHSSYPPLKAKLDQPDPHVATLVVDFTGIITQGVTQDLYAFDHGYDYTPSSLASLQFIDSGGFTYNGVAAINVGANLSINAFTTGSQFVVSIYDNFNYTGATASLSVSYYVFAENGA